MAGSDDATLTGSRVLVIGGTGTIGGAMAQAAASAGAHVILTSRRLSSAQDGADALEGDHTGVAYDPADPDGGDALAAVGPFDHVVVAAAAKAFDGLADIDPDDLRRLVDGKLLSVMWACRHVRPLLTPSSSILLLSGMLSRRPTEAAPMAAVSAGVEALGVGLAHEWAPVRVNVLAPGALGDEGLGDHAGTADDIAQLAVSVMANPWINGAVLDIHGGM